MQESLRKYVDRAFGVLQKRFQILRTYCRLWSVHTLNLVVRCCIIVHNMLVEYRRNNLTPNSVERSIHVYCEKRNLSYGFSRIQHEDTTSTLIRNISKLLHFMKHFESPTQSKIMKQDLVQEL